MDNHVIWMDNRQLIPRWHTSQNALSVQFPSLAKSNLSNSMSLATEANYALPEKRDLWAKQPSYYTAIELYSSLRLAGKHDDRDGNECLRFLLKNESDLPSGAKNLIKPVAEVKNDLIQLYDSKPSAVAGQISSLRAKVTKFPKSYMTWSDLGFYHAVVGQSDKAERCMSIAWQLASNHPYIARAYARLMVHFGEPEKAIWILKKTGGVNKEPLITSANLAISTAFNIGKVEVSKARSVFLNHTGFKGFASELGATLGTVEWFSGRKKKAREFFISALETPSENTISQYKWLTNRTGFTLNAQEEHQLPTVEGDVHQLYTEKRYSECRTKLIELFNFQPFSDAAISDAGYMSLIALNDPHFVIKMSDNRIAKPLMSFGELNNLIVAKLFIGEFNNVDLYMKILANKVANKESNAYGVYLATSGLVKFKLGDYWGGKELYQRSIDFFSLRNNQKAKTLAEHFLSLSIKDVDKEEYKRLRDRVSKKAKELKMHELTENVADKQAESSDSSY